MSLEHIMMPRHQQPDREKMTAGPAEPTMQEAVPSLTPEDLLRLVARCSNLSPENLAAYMTPNAFSGRILKVDSEDRIILIRYANDETHLVKEGKEALFDDMRRSVISPTALDNGVVHTSAALNWGMFSSWLHDARYTMYGIFKIPKAEFLELAKQHKVAVGMLGEVEVTLSGDVAAKYLVETHSESDMEPIYALIDGN